MNPPTTEALEPRVPREEDDRRPLDAGENRPAPGSVPGEPRPRVLIVDDEEGILSSLRRLLRREAYELITVANAKEALRVMEEQPVSLLISDYRMPGMSGTDLLLEVQRRWPETLRIVLSGYSEVKAIISAINEGAVYKFITKPWNDEEIKLHVRRALEQHALRAENQRMAREISLQNQRLRELNEQLDQRAADASRGLTFAQETLEMIDAGVVTIDVTGLVVTANREAVRLLAGRSGHCAGESAQRVLPETLWQAVSAEHLTASSGRVEIGGRRVQWRAGIIEAAGERRGVSLVLWEELAPTAPPP